MDEQVLLIDASNAGGGACVLLSYLTDRLRERGKSHFVLASSRCDVSPGQSKVVTGANPISLRRRFYLRKYFKELQPDCVLCFGNVPPSFHSQQLRVLTYFHNALLIPSLETDGFGLKARLTFYAIRHAIRRYAKNTTEWIFQSRYIEKQFVAEFSKGALRSHVFPFFPPIAHDITPSAPDTDFVFVSNYSVHKNHANLLKAVWKSAELGYFPRVALTIDRNVNPEIERLSNCCEAAGAKISYTGNQDHKAATRLLQSSRYAIFPSLIETIGLGIVEAISAERNVLVSDREWVDEICTPSLRFDPESPNAIAEAMIRALDTPALPKSHINIENRIDEFIDHLFVGSKAEDH